MRTLLATLLLGAALALSSMIAGAQRAAAQQFRFGGTNSGAWCAFYDPYTYNCGFQTLEQCYATAGGAAGGFCKPNPSGPPPEPRRARRQKRSARH
jgi:hypothetical protein